MLGAGDKLIADTIYCNTPPSARKKEKVGTILEVNIEKIIALKPDLVIATTLTPFQIIKRLRAFGIKTVVFSAPRNFQELCAQFIELGKIVGKEKKALEIVKEAKKKVKEIEKLSKKLPKPKVLVQVGVRPLWVATKNSFINDLIKFAGGILVGPQKYGMCSYEEVIEWNPDVIIITKMGFLSEEEKKRWESFHNINAVKNKKIYIFNSDELTSPTPLSFANTVEKVFYLIH